MPLNVCVYASASSRTSERFMQEGRRLGRLIAERGHTLINGGGKIGGMGALNDGCHAAGGRVVCVIHEMFVVDGVEFSEADEMVVAGGDDLGERKRLLAERCDAIVVMPGGVGTLDEAWDAMALSQLGMANKRPVVLCNVDGYYDATLAQLQRAHAEGLTSKPPAAIVHSVGDVEAALDWCEKAVAAGGGVSGDRATARSRGIGAGAAFLCGVAVGAIAVVACRRR